MEIAQQLALEEFEKFSSRRIAEESAGSDPAFELAAKQIEQKNRAIKKSR